MLQFITHPRRDRDIADGVRAALAGGCRWIQLRMKEATDAEIVEVGRCVRRLCTEAGATFIVDDRVDLLEELNADGVHLGHDDMPVHEARKLFPDKIIGATANTIADMIDAATSGADYIGLGPFRFTTTKKRLSPVLGIEGYRVAMQAFREVSEIPVVAIGGITEADIEPLMATGVTGIAVSGTILDASDPAEQTRLIINLLHK